MGEKGVSKTGGKEEETTDLDFSWAFWKDESGAGDASHVVPCAANLIDFPSLPLSLPLSPPWFACLIPPKR